MGNLVFYLAFATLLAHELDAVHKHEWRLLFILRRMPEDAARRAFVVAHIPLVAGLLWLLAHPAAEVRWWTMVSLDGFMVIHAGLHHRLRRHPAYAFTSAHSRGLIYGAAVLALAHLTIVAFWP